MGTSQAQPVRPSVKFSVLPGHNCKGSLMQWRVWSAHYGLGVTGPSTLNFPTITAGICLLDYTKCHLVYACCENQDKKNPPNPAQEKAWDTLPSRNRLSGSAKHILLPLLQGTINREHLVCRGLQLWTVQSLGRSPRSGSARYFLLLSLLTNLKGTSGFACNMDFIYRAGQGRFLLTKLTVENGTAVHSIITPGTWACRMLSLLTVIRISALPSNLSHIMTVSQEENWDGK